MGHYKVRRINACENPHHNKECCKLHFGAQRTKRILPCHQIPMPVGRMETASSYRSHFDQKTASRPREFKPAHNFSLPLVNSTACVKVTSYQTQFYPKNPQPTKSFMPICCFFPRECKNFYGTSSYKTQFDGRAGLRLRPYIPKDNIKIPFNRFEALTSYREQFIKKSANRIYQYAPKKWFTPSKIPMEYNMSIYQQDYQEKPIPDKFKRRKPKPFLLPLRFADLTTYRCSYQQFNYEDEPYIWRTYKKKLPCNPLQAHFFCCGDPLQGSFNHNSMSPPC